MRSRVFGYSCAVVVGLLVQFAVFRSGAAYLLIQKAAGAAPACPIANLMQLPEANERLHSLFKEKLGQMQAGTIDSKFDIQQVQGGPRSFWLKRQGRNMGPSELLAYLLADHQWICERHPTQCPQAGDVVLDVGGHVGVYSDLAFRRGAAKVIAVEPDPVNAECIRRNFPEELATGRMVLIEAGAWSSESTLELSLNEFNSGTSSFVEREKNVRTVKVPVAPIDKLLADRGIDRITYVKMDIEGAEEDALKGAAGMLKRDKPRIILDSYHHPEDGEKLPVLIKSINAHYKMLCGPCEIDPKGERIVPHVTFYF